MLAARNNYLRIRNGHAHHRVTFVELFFDLVFVFAITQLSHGLLHHLTPLGVFETALLMIAVWWCWIDTAWVTNWIDPEKTPARLLLFALMLGGLVLAASIPKAFEERAFAFAGAYILIQAGRNMFMLWATARHDPTNFLNFARIGLWHLTAAPLWIAGALVDGPLRITLWGVAVAFETSAPMVGFYVPGLGRSRTADWVVEGAHMAERCGLFVIIALGESVLITGANFANLTWTPATIAAFVIGFVGSVAMWAVYFNVGAERSSRLIASSEDPGRMARNGYTYIHILIVAGIIVVAVGDELVLHHPLGHTEWKSALVIIGGPALYLIGNLCFKRLTALHFPLSHMVGIGLLALTAFAVPSLSPLALSATTTFILIVVAVWEWWSFRPTIAAGPSHP